MTGFRWNVALAAERPAWYTHSMDDVRGALAANLAELRKEENLTQAEFAAQFNYSDKAVSKWERGDSLPDVVMLKTIADLYGLRVDDLLTDGGVAAAYAAATESGGEKQHDAYLMSKVLIAAMWVTMVWVVAVVVFLYSQFSIGKMYWMAFVWAVPVSFAVAFLFSRHWEGETTLQCVFSSLFVWSTITAFYFQYLQYNIWPCSLSASRCRSRSSSARSSTAPACTAAPVKKPKIPLDAGRARAILPPNDRPKGRAASAPQQTGYHRVCGTHMPTGAFFVRKESFYAYTHFHRAR